MNTLAGVEPALGGGDVHGDGVCSGHNTAGDWDSPRDSEEGGEGGGEGGVVVYKVSWTRIEYSAENDVFSFELMVA